MTSVSTTSSGSSKTTTPPTPAVAAANKTLNLLLQSSDVTQALSTQSSSYLPTTSDQVLSTLWALFDVNNSYAITEANVKAAVIAEGGKPSDANALWAQLSPKGAASVSPEQFITNTYLQQAVPANLSKVQAAVKTVQQQAGPGTSTDLLGSFLSEGGSGSIISDVGGGDNTTTLLDILA